MRKFSESEIGEIRSSYRQAKDQRGQIQILAQLYDCSMYEISSVLDGDTTPVSEKPEDKKPAARHRLKPAEREQYARAIISGKMTRQQVADETGLTDAAVYQIIWRYKDQIRAENDKIAGGDRVKDKKETAPAEELKTGAAGMEQKITERIEKIRSAIADLNKAVSALDTNGIITREYKLNTAASIRRADAYIEALQSVLKE